MLDENQLTVIDENGNELLCEILFTFDSDDYNKSYVVYYPAGAEHEDEDGNVDLHVSAYVPSNNNEGGELLPVSFFSRQQPAGTVDLRYFQAFFQRQFRQNGWHASGNHCFSCPRTSNHQ